MAKAKFDLKTEATRTLHAGVGVTDLAVEIVRDAVTGVQKRITQTVTGFDYQPQALRAQATKVAAARREAFEKRVIELQQDAKSAYAANLSTATETYGDLVKRGQSLVGRIRNQESTKETVKSAKTTTAKAKTTATQTRKVATATKSTAKRATSATKKRATTARSSAKATVTAATKTAVNATSAAVDAAVKVGD